MSRQSSYPELYHLSNRVSKQKKTIVELRKRCETIELSIVSMPGGQAEKSTEPLGQENDQQGALG